MLANILNYYLHTYYSLDEKAKMVEVRSELSESFLMNTFYFIFLALGSNPLEPLNYYKLQSTD